jgi:hypothetical protein
MALRTTGPCGARSESVSAARVGTGSEEAWIPRLLCPAGPSDGMLCSSFTVDAVSTESSSVEELSSSGRSLDLSYDHHSAACECRFSPHAPSWSALLTLMHSITAGNSQYSIDLLFAGEYVDRRKSWPMRTRMGLGIEG